MRLLSSSALAITAITAAISVSAQSSSWNPQQGWSGGERGLWYGAPQGSRLIPLRWLKALEQKDSTERFLSAANMDRFRYLPGGPDGMPIGFAIDWRSDGELKRTKLRWYDGQSDKEPWVGLTCAACHTGQIEYMGHRVIVDGAPSMTDFQLFIEELNAALTATWNQSDKWDRFAHAVLVEDTSSNRAKLRTAFSALLGWQTRLAAADATSLHYGFGRLDAFGRIFNKVALSVGAAIPGSNPPDAPVSYPFVWGIGDQRRLQWNGSVQNMPWHGLDLGALGRNAGEVVGVFGEVYPTHGGLTFASSIDLDNLNRIEAQLRKLQSPQWPGFLPPIDRGAANEGKKLYDTMCAECHVRPGIDPVPTRQGSGTELMSYFVPRPAIAPEAIDTDDRMACNAFIYTAPSGELKGTSYSAQDPTTGMMRAQMMGSTAPLGAMLPVVVKRVFLGSPLKLAAISWESLTNSVPPPNGSQASSHIGAFALAESRVAGPLDQRAICRTAINDNLGYKARPLSGVWATAPYLHNGSVPNLAELLLPPSMRSPTFYVGSREYDPKNVGFVTTKSDRNTFLFDTRLPGNRNVGHVYGVDRLTPDQRAQLLEYLKSL